MFKSREILDIIAVATQFNCRPSSLFGIEEPDPYLEYCIDEACTYIVSQMKDNKEPRFESNKKENKMLKRLEADYSRFTNK